MKPKNCVRCGHRAFPHSRATRKGVANRDLMQGRGLCAPCYRNCEYHGLLADYPRRTWPRDVLLDEYVVLCGQGYNWRQCADRLKIKYETFERAMCRARAAGDTRARRLNERVSP